MNIAHVVLDRDGVLNVEDSGGGYVLSPDALVWEAGALEAVRAMLDAGIQLSVATNQRCIARGLLSEAELEEIHDKLRRESGIAAVYHCPHDVDAGCRCRKPAPQLLERAIRASGVPADATIFIGDSATDLQAASAAGVAGWLVRTGKGRSTEAGLGRSAVPTFDDLADAAHAVLARNTADG